MERWKGQVLTKAIRDGGNLVVIVENGHQMLKK